MEVLGPEPSNAVDEESLSSEIIRNGHDVKNSNYNMVNNRDT